MCSACSGNYEDPDRTAWSNEERTMKKRKQLDPETAAALLNVVARETDTNPDREGYISMALWLRHISHAEGEEADCSKVSLDLTNRERYGKTLTDAEQEMRRRADERLEQLIRDRAGKNWDELKRRKIQ